MTHLIHPALVHFPIALLIVGGLTEAVGLLASRPAALRIGTILVVGGTVALIPTIASGYMAANSVALTDSAYRVLESHELAGWLVLAWFLACLFWKGWTRGRVEGSRRYLFAMALLVGVVLTVTVAFLGGELVFGHGVGVVHG